MAAMPLRVFGRRFTWRSQRPATWFTPVAMLILVTIAGGTAGDLGKAGPGAELWLDILILLCCTVGVADCLVRLVDIPRRHAHWGTLLTFALVTVILSSGFFGPFSIGSIGWTAITFGAPFGVMVWLTTRELVRLVRPSSGGSASVVTDR